LARKVAGTREGIQHVALDGSRKELLLVMLAVDIGQVDGQILEQRGGGGAVAYKRPRFAGLDLSFHKKLAVLDFDPGVFEQSRQRGRIGDLEDSRNTGARGAPAAGSTRRPRWIYRFRSRR
jgi:hypothetical protein